MRIRLPGLLLAGVLTSHFAAAAVCTRPADRAALDVAGLKSELMVTALTCGAQDKYNAFITRFRPDLQREDRDLNGYFHRAYGRRALSEHDDYITQLANVQSQAGLRDGTAFCARNLGIFDQVMALHSAADLANFAEAKQLVQPVSFTPCAAEPTVRRASVRRPEHHVAARRVHHPVSHHPATHKAVPHNRTAEK